MMAYRTANLAGAIPRGDGPRASALSTNTYMLMVLLFVIDLFHDFLKYSRVNVLIMNQLML